MNDVDEAPKVLVIVVTMPFVIVQVYVVVAWMKVERRVVEVVNVDV
jgi:hypothetical protein